MNTQPLVSIIMPCYNMEKFLCRSVDALLANEYENKEIILVDDGSSDSTSGLICDYSSRYPCVRGIYKPNGGVASARNVGLDVACGKYIMFVDPDDYVTSDYICAAVAKAEESQCDMLLMGYSTPWFTIPPIWKDYYPIENYECGSNAEIISGVFPRFFGMSSERLEKWMSGDPTWQNGKELPAACRFMFRKDLIRSNDLKFKNLKVGEDSVFIYECMRYANSLATIQSCPYKYEPLKQGAIATTLKPENILKNKLILQKEQIRIASEFETAYGRSFLDCYAGSIVIGAIQVANSICDTHQYKVWKSYADEVRLADAIDCISIRYGGGDNTAVATCVAA